MSDLFPYDLQDQIACVQREIKMRESVYPRWVANERITQRKADTELACMRAVLKTLMDLRIAEPLR